MADRLLASGARTSAARKALPPGHPAAGDKGKTASNCTESGTIGVPVSGTAGPLKTGVTTLRGEDNIFEESDSVPTNDLTAAPSASPQNFRDTTERSQTAELEHAFAVVKHRLDILFPARPDDAGAPASGYAAEDDMPDWTDSESTAVESKEEKADEERQAATAGMQTAVPVTAIALTAERLGEAMPLSVSEKARHFFEAASDRIRAFLCTQEDMLVDGPREQSLLTVTGTVGAGKGALALAAQMELPDAETGAATLAIGALPLALLGAGLAAVEMLETAGVQDHAWRRLMLHYAGALRYFKAHSNGGEIAAPDNDGAGLDSGRVGTQATEPQMPLSGSDGEDYLAFLDALKQLPEFSSAAGEKKLQASLNFSQQVGAAITNSALDDALAIGNAVKAFTPVISGALLAGAGAADAIGGVLEIGEGASKMACAGQKQDALTNRSRAASMQIEAYRKQLETGQQCLIERISASVDHYRFRSIRQSEYDRRMGIAKVVKGVVAVSTGSGFLALGIAAALGLALPPLGIVVAAVSIVATVIYMGCLIKRAHEKGQFLIESECMQYRAAHRLAGATLEQISSLYLGEMDRLLASDVNRDVAQMEISEKELRDNVYFSLHFMALVLSNRVEREKEAKRIRTMPRQPGVYRAQDVLPGRRERLGFFEHYFQIEPDEFSPLADREVARHYSHDQIAVEVIVDEILLANGLTLRDLDALKLAGKDMTEPERVGVLTWRLASLLDIEVLDKKPRVSLQ